ncbi:MAG: hypothetical protein V3V13_05795 [Paracoccaceae bacterium]
MAIKTCIEYAEESYEQCSEYRDEGHDSCSDWDDKCCSWWPCSWGCKLITWVCVGWYWVANIVCVAWTTIVTVTCIAWEVIKIVLIPIAVLIELILLIPIIGRLIDILINIIAEIIWRIVGIFDAILDAIGITLLKNLRVCVIILRDEKGTPLATEADLQPAIDSAKAIFLDAANVKLSVERVHTLAKPAPTYALDVSCGGAALGEDLWLTGSYFDLQSALHCLTGAVSRLLGYGAQITVFVIRDIPGNTAGCSLGPLSDYVTVEGARGICFAHELAHACGLWHHGPASNLANGTCGGTDLKWWQRVIVRNSRHVTYL